jgi:hypothetical protein
VFLRDGCAYLGVNNPSWNDPIYRPTIYLPELGLQMYPDVAIVMLADTQLLWRQAGR